MLPKQKIGNDKKAIQCLVLSCFICVAVFLLTIPLPRSDGHLTGSDGLSYYAITQSMILDQDLDFTNDYKWLGVSQGLTAIGVPANPFAIGTALLWIPFFLVAHLVSVLLNLIGFQLPLNGTGYIYEACVCLATIIYASLGFILAYRTIRKTSVGDSFNSWCGTIAMWWATPAIYYIIAEPSMSHGLTVFTLALFMSVWYPPSPNRSIRDWVKIGLATGLVALVRWQDGIIALIPLVEICWWMYQRKLTIVCGAYRIFIFVTTLVIAFLPQMLMWKAVYGVFLTIPQGSDFLVWDQPQIIQTLFSTRHGLISWHPIFLLAILGLIPLWKKDKVFALVIIFMFVGELYVNSAVCRWWADDAFGGRRFTSLVPLFAVSLASLLTMEKMQKWIIVCIVILIIWNGLSLFQYRLGFVSMSAALTLREMTVDRVLIPLEVFGKFLSWVALRL